jgi:hypothetical protein
MATGDITIKFKTATGEGTKTVTTKSGDVTTKAPNYSSGGGGSSGGKSAQELENERLTTELNKTLNQFVTASSNSGLPTEEERKQFVKNVSNIYGVNQGEIYNSINPALNDISQGKNPGQISTPQVVKTGSGYAFTPGSTGAGSSTLTVSGNTRTVSQDGVQIYGERDVTTSKNNNKSTISTNDSNSNKIFGGGTQIIEKQLPQERILTALGSPEDMGKIISEKGTFKEYARKIKNVPMQVSDYFSSTFNKGRENLKSGNSYNILTGAVQTTGTGLLISGYYGVKTFVGIVNPVENVKGVYSLITSPVETFKGLQEGAEELGQGLQGGSPKSLGILGGIVAGAKYGPMVESKILTTSGTILGKGVKLAKEKYIENILPEINPNTILNPISVKTGKGIVPVENSGQILKAYNEAQGIVVSIGPSQLPFNKLGEVEIIAGRRGKLGLEDEGFFTTALKQGEPHFARIGEELVSYSGETQLSLNPKTIFSQFSTSFNEAVRIPEANIIPTLNIAKTPKNIELTPGFQAVSKFGTENVAGTGYIRLTKRGQIGKGELPSQEFNAPVSFNKLETGGITAISPTRGKVTEVTKGERLVEAGTTEPELVADVGNVLRNEGLIGYTKFKGEKILVRLESIKPKNGDINLNQNNIKQKLLLLEDKSKPKTNLLEVKRDFKPGSGKVSRDSYNLEKVTKRPTSSPLSYGALSSKVSSGGLSSKSLSFGVSSGVSSFGSSKGGSLSGSSKGLSGTSRGVSIPTSVSLTGKPSPVSKGSSGVSSRTGGVSSGLSSPSPTSGSIFTPPVVKRPVIPRKKRKEEQQNKAYDVVYRERGRVVKLNPYPLPKNRAFNLAQEKVDNTTARSLELRTSGTTNLKDDPKKNNTYKYRVRKTRKALILVEKEKYAIDTKGEKRGLKISRGNF